MKMNKEKKKLIIRKLKQNKGITLIALVVTIIVLLILAGISIQMLVGEGGILTNAKEASSETKKSTAKERIELEIAEAVLEDKELTAEGLNKKLVAHIPDLTHERQSLTENPINELPAIVELDGFAFQIDEFGKVTEMNGILLNKNSLKLQIEVSGDEKIGEETELTATLIGISGNITWNAEEKDIIDVTPLEGGTSATITAKSAGEATVIATCSGKTAKCSITVEEVQSPYIDNSYVQYDVEYTDVQTKKQYTKNTGWRAITDLKEYEATGEYTGKVDIISTGIPAKLYFDYKSIKDAPWAEEGRADDGLLNHFGEIEFNKSDILSDSTIKNNQGGFIDIVTNEVQATGENIKGESLFIDQNVKDKITKIRSVDLVDAGIYNLSLTSTNYINDRNGLFILQNYTPDVHDSGFYWIVEEKDYSSLCFVNSHGVITEGSKNVFGVRPVVCLEDVQMKLNGHVWKIVN